MISPDYFVFFTIIFLFAILLTRSGTRIIITIIPGSPCATADMDIKLGGRPMIGLISHTAIISINFERISPMINIHKTPNLFL